MHTILLALRAGAFFAWLGCWCVWLSCRAKLPAALTPLAAMCGSSLVIYAAALLNVIWPVQLALYLAGPVLAVGCVIREFVKEDLETGRLVQLKLGSPIHKRTVGFIYDSSHSSTALDNFLAFLRQEA